MSLRIIANEFKQGLREIEGRRVESALKAAADALALGKTRVINQRVDHFGSEFGTYADSTFRQKKAKRGSNRAINFSETNRMWATTLPSIAEVTPQYIAIIFRPTDPGRAEIFDYHQNRFGPLILLNARESAILTTIYLTEIQRT